MIEMINNNHQNFDKSNLNFKTPSIFDEDFAINFLDIITDYVLA